ncbi:endonuclease VII [Phage MedPE-SWcel-C56]|uniref:Recombination endonuclease VII n=1 Tax=Phage MedPE-SWcel-C56 TaxID=1871314 RepID=A0A1B1IY31_9CAUD|nr:endonuclease VII [Phage MedPE-SWcel-C56]ANS06225.1 hypothetical protein [Phage MedPE-SWcel-C56]
MRKLKQREIATVRASMLKAQGNKCALCDGALHASALKNPVLDHCHTGGHIRGVLCVNCNAMEGKIKTSANRAKNKMSIDEWLRRLVEYWEKHSVPQVPLLHPTFKTAEEKRVRANKLAKIRRDKLKALKK